MKKILLTLLAVMGLISFRSSAQVSINVNIGSQPLWGPVGYDRVDYYYLPDVESYYYVPKRQFIYLAGGRWIFAASLPSRYRGYDLYNGYKVVINSREAYRNFDHDRIYYAKYKNKHGQKVIRYSEDPRYYVIKGHPHGIPPGQAKKIYSQGKARDKNNWKEHKGDKGHKKH